MSSQNNIKKKNTGHDLLAWRLTSILEKLNCGERLSVEALAEEFRVSPRTIQRDLLDRFAFLPLEKTNGHFFLNSSYLGKLSFRDIERFASLAGLNGLFPALNSQFLKELFDRQIEATLNVHGHSYEDISHRMDDFRKIMYAIQKHHLIRFQYTKPDEEKEVRVAPYRLVNNNGIWYLAASHEGKPKSYTFMKISLLHLLDEEFSPNPSMQALLDEEDSIWLNEKKTEVVMTVAPEVATYFQRRKIISQQKIEKVLEDGGLIVSGRFAHPNQILPSIRYWIPHVRIVSPVAWQEELDKSLKHYLPLINTSTS